MFGLLPPRDDNDFVVMDPDPLRRVTLAVEDVRAGRMVILVDDEDRENEGDLTMAAARVTPEAINFMATYARGLICLSLTARRVDELGLPMMASRNNSRFGTGFTVSIEARRGVSTGISAHDRARTIQVAIDAATGPDDLVIPGHIFPLRARDGGVLVRTGQTEGSVDLARMAGLDPSGVICEVMNEDGTMARLPDLERFGARHRIRIVTVADIARWRLIHEQGVALVGEEPVQVGNLGEFRARVYRSNLDGGLHMALLRGDPTGAPPPLVRVQARCPVGDALRGGACDCGPQLDRALAAIAREGRGVLVYMNLHDPEDAERRILGHLRPAPPLEEDGPPPQDEAFREFGLGAQVLADLGVRTMRLLTNNPRKIVALEGFGLRVAERVALPAGPGSRKG